jgi:hypothetical protein
VTAPERVASGAGGSLYVQDAHGIEHFARSGTLLAHVGLKRVSFVTDRAGNVYVPEGDQIVKESGRGAVLARMLAPGYQPEAVDRQGTIVAVQGGSLAALDSQATVERLAPSGRVLSRWSTPYASALAMGADGFLYGQGGINAGGDLVKLDPATGSVLRLFPRGPGESFDALTADLAGTLYIGATTNADAPFAIEKVTRSGNRYVFDTLKSAQESVSGLAVDGDGTIFVIRSSYAEPGAGGGTGLEVLSPSGSSQGKVAFCK